MFYVNLMASRWMDAGHMELVKLVKVGFVLETYQFNQFVQGTSWMQLVILLLLLVSNKLLHHESH